MTKTQLKEHLKPFIIEIMNESNLKENSRFGRFSNAKDMKDLIPMYGKEFQSYLKSNNMGGLRGIIVTKGIIKICGETGYVDINMNSDSTTPVATGLIYTP